MFRLSAVLLLLGLAGSAEAGGLLGEESFTLTNGLQVVVVPNHRAPIVTHWVWYRVGGADEVRGRSGSAHFLEHLMFKGTKTMAPKEFSERVARVGGEENAFTSWDYTAFFQTVAADRLELVMSMEADRMQNLVITEDQLVPERDVVQEEWRMRTGNVPGALLDLQAEAALYLNSPYRIPVLGWLNEIKTLDVPTERAFYDTWYAPNNAILIVAGDVTPDAVRALAEKYYGPIPARPVPERARLQEPDRKGEVAVTLRDSRVRQPEWGREYLAPSFRAGGDTPYALQVLASVLGDGAAGRLHQALVLKQALATDIDASYDASRWDESEFSVSADARGDVPLDRVAKAADLVLADLVEHGATDEEVARAKRRLVTAETYAADDLVQPVMIIGRALTTGRSLDQLDHWPDHIAAVTAAEVTDAARLVLKDRPSVEEYLLPKPGAPGAPPPAPPPPSSAEIR